MILGFLVGSPNLEYKHVLTNVLVTSTIIALDLLVVDSVVFAAHFALAKLAPNSGFTKVFVPKVIQELKA